MSDFPEPCEENHHLADHAARLARSYRRWTGLDLIDGERAPDAAARALYHAPFAVVSHDTQPDPIFNYANLAAQALFAMSWDEITSMPSRHSAEPVDAAMRDRLLAEVTAKGFITGYEGVRIAKSGRRFLIRNAVVWNVVDDAGEYRGQAARIAEWSDV